MSLALLDILTLQQAPSKEASTSSAAAAGSGQGNVLQSFAHYLNQNNAQPQEQSSLAQGAANLLPTNPASGEVGLEFLKYLSTLHSLSNGQDVSTSENQDILQFLSSSLGVSKENLQSGAFDFEELVNVQAYSGLQNNFSKTFDFGDEGKFSTQELVEQLRGIFYQYNNISDTSNLQGEDLEKVNEIQNIIQSILNKISSNNLSEEAESFGSEEGVVVNNVSLNDILQKIQGEDYDQDDFAKAASELIVEARQENQQAELPATNLRLDQASTVLQATNNGEREKDSYKTRNNNLSQVADSEIVGVRDNIAGNVHARSNVVNQINAAAQHNTSGSEQINDDFILNNFTQQQDADLTTNLTGQTNIDSSTVQQLPGGRVNNVFGGHNVQQNVHQSVNADEIIAQIKFGVTNSSESAPKNITVQLYPKELGSIDVRMEIGTEGRTVVSIIAERADTLNLLQKESGLLRDMLQDALKVDSSSLDFAFQEKGSDNLNQFSNDNFSENQFAETLEEEEPLGIMPYQSDDGNYEISILNEKSVNIRV